MAIWNRESSGDSPRSHSPSRNDQEYGKTEYQSQAVDPPATQDDRTQLHRGLKARHITMIAIGGAIGTGLIIGTGAALARAGYELRP